MHYHPIAISRCYILTKYGSDVNLFDKILYAKCYSSAYRFGLSQDFIVIMLIFYEIFPVVIH